MSETTTCSRCGKPSGRRDLLGLCPDCLLAEGFGGVADATAPGASARFAPPSLDALAPLFPQLEIEALLGCGGMGAVYRARQRNLDRVVALKILPPDIGGDPAFAARFAREAKALAKLNHPNIVTLYEFGQAGDLFYFLMEYVDGVNLRQVVQNERIAPREALAIVPQICEALQYAHDQGIVHRDIKPENILLDRRGRVKVADFGVAKLVRAAEPSQPADRSNRAADGDEISHASLVMGTPSYMAPEQRERPTEVDHRADIYSLGVVFYQMLTGELPKTNAEPPSRKVTLDVRLDDIVLRALEKTPERRYQQVSEIKTLCETLSLPAAPSRPSPTPNNERGGSELARGLLAIRAVILCVAGLVIGLHLHPALLGVTTEIWGVLGAIWILRLLFVPETGQTRESHAARRRAYAIGQLQALGVLSASLYIALSNQCGLTMEWSGFVAGLSLLGIAVSIVRLARFLSAKSKSGNDQPPPAPERERRFSGVTEAPAPDWTPPDSGWGWLIGKVFGFTFTSQAAWSCANLSALGFFGALGFLGYCPGLRWCFGLSGFAGFFGLIGVAQFIELASRRRRHSPSAQGFALVGRRGDRVAIRWPDVAGAFIGLFTLSALAFSIFSMTTRGTFDALGTVVTGTAFAATFLWVRISDRKKALLAQPSPEIGTRVSAVHRWGEIPWIPYSVFLVLYLAFLVLLALSAKHLPPRVATHFGFNGQANGWLDRDTYFTFLCVLLAAMAAFWVGFSLFVRTLPARYINIPRKDYWLAPERRALTSRILLSRKGWMLCLITLFFSGLHLLTVQANRISPPQLPMGGLLVLTIAFLLGTLIWVSLLLMRFAEAGIPGQHEEHTATQRRRAHRSIGILFAVTAMIALRMWVVGVYTVHSESASPEMPQGSVVLVWKPARALSPGDLVVYRTAGRFWVGRVSDVRDDAVRIARNREPETLIPTQALRGRVISILWRGTPEKKAAP